MMIQPSETQSASENRPRFETVLYGALLLFGFSLALSKSATNIVLVLVYLSVFYLVAKYSLFRQSLIANVRQPLLVPLGLYLAVAVAGLLFTTNMTDGTGIVNKMTQFAFIYLMTSVLLSAIELPGEAGLRGEQLLFAFLAGMFILDIIGILTYFGVVAHRKHFLPLSALNVYHIWFANVNAVAVYTACAILLFSPEKKNVRSRIFLFLLLPLALISILLSLSRTAWLGMIITIIVLAFFVIRSKKLIFIAILGMLAAGLGLYLFSTVIQSRMNQIVADISLFASGQARTNVGERFVMWQSAFRMFLSNPLFGVGTGDYVLTMRSYIDAGEVPSFMLMFNQPHNIYLFAMATNGLFGLTALLFIFYVCLKNGAAGIRAAAGNRQRMFSFLALATAVHYMTAGLTESMFNIQILRYTFAFVMGICVRYAGQLSRTGPAGERGRVNSPKTISKRLRAE